MKYVVLFTNGLFKEMDTLKEVEALLLGQNEGLVKNVFKGEEVTFKKVEKISFGKRA